MSIKTVLKKLTSMVLVICMFVSLAAPAVGDAPLPQPTEETVLPDGTTVYADGSLIFYSASQTLPEGYEQTVAPITTTLSDSTGAWYGSMTITDTHEVETMSIAATKTWDDADFAALSDRGYTRPSSVSVRLTDDHGVTSDYEEATLSEANGWSHTWDNLPRYRVNEETQEREPIVYTVEETSKAKGYDVSYKVNGAAEVLMIDNVTHKHSFSVYLDETGNYYAKVWAELLDGSGITSQVEQSEYVVCNLPEELIEVVAPDLEPAFDPEISLPEFPAIPEVIIDGD